MIKSKQTKKVPQDGAGEKCKATHFTTEKFVEVCWVLYKKKTEKKDIHSFKLINILHWTCFFIKVVKLSGIKL